MSQDPLEPLLRTALSLFFEPRRETSCEYYGGVLELFQKDPLTVGICVASGQQEHIGVTWIRKVCLKGKTCPFYTKAKQRESFK